MMDIWVDPEWNKHIAALPGAHVLQTREWAAIKAPVGWRPTPQTWKDGSGQLRAGAMILERSLAFGKLQTPVKVAYVPRGPVMDWSEADRVDEVLADLEAEARRSRAIFIKIDPEVLLGRGIPGEAEAYEHPLGAKVIAALKRRKWRFSPDQIQFRNTVWIDLDCSESELIERMKPKMRYNIRLAERKGVRVRTGGLDDLALLYQMYGETSIRDGFVIRGETYYRTVWETFLKAGLAEPLIAEVGSEPVAGMVVFRFAGRAWYLYGMSRDLHREKMPNALLQWEAMRRARQAGCSTYDLWGAPDVFSETDPMWGVFRFKRGLGGEVIRTIGAWDYAPNPGLYTTYTEVLPHILDVLRRRGRKRTREEVAGG